MDNLENSTEELLEESQETVEEALEQPNPLSMSDEEFLEYEEKDALTNLEAPTEEAEETLDEGEAIASEEAEEEPTDSEIAPESTEVEFSKESAYDELMSEFKANGKLMKVDSVDEARKLMQMGANYQKKMVGFKENTKIIKMLENNQLLDESKLNFLIDVANKDPAAIKQLMKEADIDPLDLDLDDGEYTPNNHKVDDKTVQLDEVLGNLQDSEGYTTTMDIIGTQWDKASRAKLANEPNLIADLNANVESGIYDEVQAVLEKERMLGNLEGVSDFDAYVMVGNAMHTQGMFKSQQVNAKAEPTGTKQEVTNNANELRKAAAPTRATRPTKQAKDIVNPLSMSDEEFIKRFGS